MQNSELGFIDLVSLLTWAGFSEHAKRQNQTYLHIVVSDFELVSNSLKTLKTEPTSNVKGPNLYEMNE